MAASPRISKPRPAATGVYQLRIELKHLKPAIWRRVLVPETATLAQLHRILQIVMGWTDSHLHEFTIGNTRYGIPNREWPDDNPAVNEKRVILAQVLDASVKRLNYAYDFGDGWEHSVRVEKRHPAGDLPGHPVCTEGKNACPPEDVGGPAGYCAFVEAILDPHHPEHDEMLDWCAGRFDPFAFDIETVNRQLKRIKL
jgi:hypothetical protein